MLMFGKQNDNAIIYENKMLRKENARLRRLVETYESTHEKLKKQSEEYAQLIQQTREIKKKYQEAIDDINNIKYNYEADMKELMQKVKGSG